jgi:hypothetical protein
MTAEIVGNKNLKGTIKDKKIPAGNPQKKTTSDPNSQTVPKTPPTVVYEADHYCAPAHLPKRGLLNFIAH